MTLTRPEPINMMTLPLSTRDAGNDAGHFSGEWARRRDSGNLLFSIHEEIRPQIDFGADAATYSAEHAETACCVSAGFVNLKKPVCTGQLKMMAA